MNVRNKDFVKPGAGQGVDRRVRGYAGNPDAYGVPEARFRSAVAADRNVRAQTFPPINVAGVQIERRLGGRDGARAGAGFTMIEIAISLAVIAFALVAIIGVLPSGMNVQRDNRQETVIIQDFSVFLNAIRDGSRGLDDLTNYVVAITNYATEYNDAGKPNPTARWGYTQSGSFRDNAVMSPQMPITNGLHIVGLLSTPKYVPFVNGRTTWVRSNYIVAQVRSLSGPATEKFPQTNASLQDLAFTYRLYSELVPHLDYDRSWTNFTDPTIAGRTNEIIARSNFWLTARSLQTNLYDFRLRFRWPVLPNGGVGVGQQTFRTMFGGHLLGPTNESNLDPGYGTPVTTPWYSLYLFQSRSYVSAQ